MARTRGIALVSTGSMRTQPPPPLPPPSTSPLALSLLAAVRSGQLHELARLLAGGASVLGVYAEKADSLLHVAAKEGCVEIVRAILEAEGGVRLLETTNSTAKTPLHCACKIKNNAKVVGELLALGANGNAVDQHKRTPLHLACRTGSHDTVELLVKYGVELNKMDYKYGRQRNALFYLVEKEIGERNIATVKLLLTNGAIISPRAPIWISGETPYDKELYVATWNNCLEVAKLLVDYGANLELHGGCGTVLLIAIQRSYLDLVKLFLAHGADANNAMHGQYLPLRAAMKRPEAIEITKLLLKHGASTRWGDGNFSALDTAAGMDNFELFKIVLEHEAQDSLRTEALGQALISACSNGRGMEITQMLLGLGASPLQEFEDGSTALHRACMTSNSDLVKLLLAHGADPNQASLDGHSTLHAACSQNDCEQIVQLLLDRGVEINKRVLNLQSGLTALALASAQGAVKSVKMLLDYGADTSIAALVWGRDNRYHAEAYNITPTISASVLHHACCYDVPEVVQVLLEHGIDPNIRDLSGNTPLHMAGLRYSGSVVSVLAQHGADIHALNEEGFSPLTMAVRWNVSNVVWEPVHALHTAYELMKLGAVYEDSPANCPVMGESSFISRPGIPISISFYERSLVVKICIKHWTVERQAGKPLTPVPVDVAYTGGPAVEKYLKQVATVM